MRRERCEEVRLTVAERAICTWVGRQRFANARRIGRNPGGGPPHTIEDFDVRGASCEFACSVMLNLFWRPTIGRLNERDVGALIEVRSGTQPHHRLIIKPSDIQKGADTPFVLIVAHRFDVFTFGGWLFAGDAPLRSELVTDHGDAAYFVPRDRLEPFDALLALIR